MPLLDDAYTLARHLVRDEHDAQDIVQEAYLRAWRFFGSFRDGDEKAWLLTIVRNCCHPWKRKRGGDDSVSYDDELHGLSEAARFAADTPAIEHSERAQLDSALDALPTEFREVLVLRELDGFSYREIARIIGAPVGTVMSRLARGRERLRQVVKRSA